MPCVTMAILKFIRTTCCNLIKVTVMKSYFYIFLALAFIMLPSKRAEAFVIFDVSTKVQDIAEKVIEWAKYASERISASEHKLRDSKLGKMGAKAHEHYTKLNKFLIRDRKLGMLKVPTYISSVATSVDGTYAQIQAKYVPTFGGGQDAAKKNNQARHNMEVQHNLVADVYARAFTLRNTLVEERKKGELSVKPENTRELIEAGRAYNEKMIQRYVDILSMETAMLDFDNTSVLMEADPRRLQRAKDVSGDGEEK